MANNRSSKKESKSYVGIRKTDTIEKGLKQLPMNVAADCLRYWGHVSNGLKP